MTDAKKTFVTDQQTSWRAVVGLALIIGGSLALIDQALHVGWLTSSVLVSGIVLLMGGVRLRSYGLLIGGSIIIGLGSGLFAAYSLPGDWTVVQRAGWGVALFGMGFGMIPITTGKRYPFQVWWTLFPFCLFASIGYCLLLRPFQMSSFILYPPAALGIAMAGIGLYKKWIGFIIPACLLIFSGLGVYIPWVSRFTGNPLTRTGTMLVIFAFGWGLITVLSRPITHKFVWWPLIPGGVLAVVGWGLYIGGDPNSALAFIGNTGSVVMVILGLYLLLLRRGMRQ